jgi:hypothetical protein
MGYSFLLRTAVLVHSFVYSSFAQTNLYINPDYYTPSNFFTKFTFQTVNDPTHGFVEYVASASQGYADSSSYQSQSAAQSAGLISSTSSYVRFGADSSSVVASGARGRKSVRLESTTAYTRGLFVLDADHMPGEACGVWPSWFMYGPNWPSNGEIGTSYLRSSRDNRSI